MIKMIITLLTISLSQSVFASELTFQELTGCYRSVEINGDEVTPGPSIEKSQSTIEMTKSPTFYHIDTKDPLTVPQIVLFTGYNHPWYGYHSFIPFLELGHIQKFPGRIEYTVDADVYMKNWGRFSKVDHKLDLVIQDLGDGRLEGEITFSSRARRMSGHKSFLLEKENCIQD